MLETLRSYAEDRLAQTGEAAHVRDLHAAHFHSLASANGRSIATDVRLGARLADDRSNLTAAFEWLTASDQWVAAGELLLGSVAAYDGHGHSLEAVGLFDSCIGPVGEVDGELADFLRSSIISALVLNDDWPRIAALAQVLLISADPRSRAFGHGWLAFLLALGSPLEAAPYRGEAARHLDTAKAERPGGTTDRVEAAISDFAGYHWLFAGDAKSGLACFSAAETVMARHDELSWFEQDRQLIQAMCHILNGATEHAFELIDSAGSFHYAYGTQHEYRALAHLADGDVETATQHTRQLCQDAVTGRISRQCNDAVLVLAAVGHAENDSPPAIELLCRSGLGRSPVTIVYARHLARRLDVVAQHAALEQIWIRGTDQTAGILGRNTAMHTLALNSPVAAGPDSLHRQQPKRAHARIGHGATPTAPPVVGESLPQKQTCPNARGGAGEPATLPPANSNQSSPTAAEPPDIIASQRVDVEVAANPIVARSLRGERSDLMHA